MTSSSAIRDVIRVAARCDQADDLSEGLESARSTARSPEGIETRLHAVCHYGSCDACDGPGVELRGRPRVGLGVALSLVCGPWTPTRGKPERRRGPPCFGAEPERGAEPLALSRRLVLSFVGRRARCGGWVGACRARAPTAVSTIVVSRLLSVCYGYPVTGYNTSHTFWGTAAVAARHGRPSGPDWTLRTRPPSVPGATRASSPAPGPCSTLSRLTSAMHVALISPFCREGAAKGVLHPASPRPPHASTTLSMRRVLPRRTAIAASTPAASSPPVLPPSIPSSSWPSCMLARLR